MTRIVTTRTVAFAVLAAVLLGAPSLIRTIAQSAPLVPGALPDGSTLLSNGWRIAPAGRQVTVGDLPLNATPTPDGKYVVVTNNGLAKPSFSIVNASTWAIKGTTPLEHAWYGLAWHPDGTKMYSSGANQNSVQEFGYADGVLTPLRTIALPRSPDVDTFTGGIAISADGKMLYATRVFSMTVSSIDLASGQVVKTVAMPAEPYTCVVSADGRRLFVSLWGGSLVLVLDAATLTQVAYLPTSEHPSAMALSSDGTRLFVACASSAEVWVFNTQVLVPIEQISMSLFPTAPATSTPNSLAVSPDGQTLIASLADNNAVAVVDISNSVRSNVLGFIPTGWYPTGAVFSKDGSQIYILSGRGLTPAANPTNGNLEKRLLGAAAIVPRPDRTTLAEYTRKVYSVTPLSDATILTPPNIPAGSPIPRSIGLASPIKHVFYVIRENRTYDQILGDLPQGNGDPRLAIFGKDITPNAHAIAQNFVLFDNFYVDAEVSYNGHAFSTAAYATDFIEKMWQTGYGGRGGVYLSEGGGFMRNPFGNITTPQSGYIWDYAVRNGVTVRSYGEFVTNVTRSGNGDVTAAETVPGLAGLVAPRFAGWDLEIKDQKRIDTWLDEFNGFVQNRNLPQLSIIRLANDHTSGTRPGARTPRAMVADNDLALGRLLETISSSPYWKDSAIFVLEDDAQSGPDHVDSHRSVLLVASPFAKHGVVDHTFYSTSSVLRTIELILGLPPMSTYDAAATPLHAGFNLAANMAGYSRIPATVSLDEQNLPSAVGASLSSRMDFSDADRTDEVLLNEILWRSQKGAAAIMPPPRRSVLVKPSGSGKDDDDD